MDLNINQIRFICNAEYEPKRYIRLNEMIDKFNLNRNIIKFDCITYKHTINDELYNKYVKTSLKSRFPWVSHTHNRKSDVSLILNYIHNLEDIYLNFKETNGIFMIFESDVLFNNDFIDNLYELIKTLKTNYGKWDAIHIGDSTQEKNLYYEFNKEEITNDKNIIRLDRHFAPKCTDSIIYSTNGINKLLDYFKNNTNYYVPIDYLFLDFLKDNNNYKNYHAVPSLCVQMSNCGLDKSTIKD